MTKLVAPKTLYSQVAEILREEMKTKQPGARLESESALSKRFSVSLATIRDALMQLSSEGLVNRYHGKGTFVAERKPKDGQRHVAIVIDKDISHPQLSYSHRRATEYLLRFFEQRNIAVKRYTGRKAPWEDTGELTCPEFLEAVEQDLVQAAVLKVTQAKGAWADTLRQRSVPIIGGWASPTHVVSDYKKMMYSGVDYLHDNGCKKIALLEWHRDLPSPWHGPIIYEAFTERMRKYGLPLYDKWINRDMLVSTVGIGWEGFRQIWGASNEKPDGLIVTDDILFRDAASAILELGIKVPQELMVVTLANKNSGMFYPLPVARMENNPENVAQRLGEITLRALAGKSIEGISNIVDFKWIDAEKPRVVAGSIEPASQYKLEVAV